MQHKSRLVVAIVLMLALVNPAQAATPKAGAKCTKAGTTATASGKKFTCIKSGTKLVWNKGVAIKAAPKPSPNPVFNPVEPTPAATSTPTSTPTPTATPEPPKGFYQRFAERDSVAVRNFELWRKNSATGLPQSNIQYWFGSQVPKNIVEESMMRMNSAVLQWERFHKVYRSKIYFDLAMKEESNERCLVMKPRSVQFTLDWCQRQTENSLKNFFYLAAAYESEGGWRPILDPKLSPQASVSHSYVLFQDKVFYTDTFLPRIEHEWIHQIQYDLSGNTYIREYPVWFIEGSAEYLGLLTASMNDPDYFFTHRAAGWISDDSSLTVDYFKTWISKTTVPRLSYTDYSDALPSDGSPYRYGALVTEWLVGKIGFTGIVSLMRDTESMGWVKAFEKHVGATQAAVRDEIAEYLYAERTYLSQNRLWPSLPRCKSLAYGGVIEVNKGVCNSFDGRLAP
jgi:hypothetical protein